MRSWSAARAVGAHTVWVHSGVTVDRARDPAGRWLSEDAAAARSLVEGVGLVYVDQPYIAGAAHMLG